MQEILDVDHSLILHSLLRVGGSRTARAVNECQSSNVYCFYLTAADQDMLLNPDGPIPEYGQACILDVQPVRKLLVQALKELLSHHLQHAENLHHTQQLVATTCLQYA